MMPTLQLCYFWLNLSAGVLSKSKFKFDPFLCRTTDRGIVKTKKLAKQLHPLIVLSTFSCFLKILVSSLFDRRH